MELDLYEVMTSLGRVVGGQLYLHEGELVEVNNLLLSCACG